MLRLVVFQGERGGASDRCSNCFVVKPQYRSSTSPSLMDGHYDQGPRHVCCYVMFCRTRVCRTGQLTSRAIHICPGVAGVEPRTVACFDCNALAVVG
jgi:hypothetical protein